MKTIPKGWLKYEAMGEPVAGTKIIPFKVPLTEELCSPRISSDQWFTPSILLQKQPGLKAVIDLTDTTRYYDPQEFSREGVAHVKIRITGGGALPPLRKLRFFFQTMDKFMDKYANDPDALVGVHCTHGLNRTGYFICHYMVDRLEMSPDDAIARFEAARGHNMHRVNFINEIKKFGGQAPVIPREITPPPRPKESMEYTSPLGDDFDDYVDQSSTRSSGRSWRHRKNTSKSGSTSGHNEFKGFKGIGRSTQSDRPSNSHPYDSKSGYSRERRSNHPRERESSSITRNWRERP